jgi:hypothetical protein
MSLFRVRLPNNLYIGSLDQPGKMVVSHRKPTQNNVAAKIPANQGYLQVSFQFKWAIDELTVLCICLMSDGAYSITC